MKDFCKLYPLLPECQPEVETQEYSNFTIMFMYSAMFSACIVLATIIFRIGRYALVQAATIYTVGSHPGDKYGENAGLDMILAEDVVVPPCSTVRAQTTLACNMPRGYFAMCKERSSTAVKGCTVYAGVIDSGYTANLTVVIANTSTMQQVFYKNERISQLLLFRCPLVNFKSVTSNDEFPYRWRGKAGFGSTGK